MFKKFDAKEDVVGSQQLKSSVQVCFHQKLMQIYCKFQKSIRSKLVEQYPLMEPYIDQVLPKKENFKLVKCREHLELIADPAGGVQFVKVFKEKYF